VLYIDPKRAPAIHRWHLIHESACGCGAVPFRSFVVLCPAPGGVVPVLEHASSCQPAEHCERHLGAGTSISTTITSPVCGAWRSPGVVPIGFAVVSVAVPRGAILSPFEPHIVHALVH